MVDTSSATGSLEIDLEINVGDDFMMNSLGDPAKMMELEKLLFLNTEYEVGS